MDADTFALEGAHLVGAAAKDAGRLQFAQDNAGAFDTDEQLIAFTYVEEPAGFCRDDNPPQVIDLASDARFQCRFPL